MIDKEKWLKGQLLEREWHNKENAGYDHYKDTYEQYFKYLDIDSYNIRNIIEVGCADYPALLYTFPRINCSIIEPMPSEILKKFCSIYNIQLFQSLAEEIEWPKANETWLFNVLQHVMDPEIIINKAKEATNIIRFFEPIDLPTDMMHFHSFTLDWYKDRFGDCVKHYPKNPDAINFHKWECCYGVYKKNN